MKITPEMITEHGLTIEEFDRLIQILGREPNLVELGIFSVMWSEHCSYKSSRRWLQKLPTEAPWVIQGPGENAGVVDIGDGQAAVFKMESHNHPSFIEPYQGAATGVGGILRDIFTMGARPVCNINALRFGDPNEAKTRHLVSGVVAGIGGYGNCVGVPTVGGECEFHSSYDGNILVNAMTVGLTEKNRIFYSAATGVGNAVVYVGSKTGRDGIHGATMASAEFDDNSEVKRPTVQVGDPFTEKLLIEACLELMATNAIVAIQDMGAAGLTSSSVEMTSKGGVGIELDLDMVPVREGKMTPYEIMLSESQERMLIVLKQGAEKKARKIFEKWELDFSVIGRLTATKHLVLKKAEIIVADIPLAPLVSQAPNYDRKRSKPPSPKILPKVLPNFETPIEKALLKLLGSSDLCSKRWIWEQYDHMVMADTVQGPGGDAAVIRVHGTDKGLAITSDCTPRYCFADPKEGGKQAVVEAWRNLISVGARPLAVTDNLNFGNPERPEIMAQFAECISGMADACKKLQFPVVSGNVSFYNETKGKAILPTPVIGAIGVIDNIKQMTNLKLKRKNEAIVLIGETNEHIGASIWLREIGNLEAGPPPKVNLELENKNGRQVQKLISTGLATACHDISDGGLLVALAEMVLGGNIGCSISIPREIQSKNGWLFGEDQGRYLITTNNPEKVLTLARKEKVYAKNIGKTCGLALTVSGETPISIKEMRVAHEGWLPNFMAKSRTS